LTNKGVIPPLVFKIVDFNIDSYLYPLLILGLSPALEEFAFRLFLYPSRMNLAFSFPLLLYYLVCLVLSVNLFAINAFLLIFPIAFLFAFAVTKNKTVCNYLSLFIKQHYRPIFYLSTTAYTLVHLANFFIERWHWAWLPLILLPYLTLGCILGYVRIVWGIKHSIILHLLYNITLFVLGMLFVL
jgi:hypothetical protein